MTQLARDKNSNSEKIMSGTFCNLMPDCKNWFCQGYYKVNKYYKLFFNKHWCYIIVLILVVKVDDRYGKFKFKAFHYLKLTCSLC